MNAFIPISQLPLAGPLFGDEQIAIVQNGRTVRATSAIVASISAAPVYLNKVLSLVYVATAGQSNFPCSVADKYGNAFILTKANGVAVTAAGLRLVEDNGLGFGDFTLNYDSNSVTLLAPATAGDVVVIDIYALMFPTYNALPGGIRTEPLTIVTLNVIPPLTVEPDGEMVILYVNGRAFSSAASPPDFTVFGETITWINTVYSVDPGATVVACYTYGAYIPPNLPRASNAGLPSGALWNNGGFVCVA